MTGGRHLEVLVDEVWQARDERAHLVQLRDRHAPLHRRAQARHAADDTHKGLERVLRIGQAVVQHPDGSILRKHASHTPEGRHWLAFAKREKSRSGVGALKLPEPQSPPLSQRSVGVP